MEAQIISHIWLVTAILIHCISVCDLRKSCWQLHAHDLQQIFVPGTALLCDVYGQHLFQASLGFHSCISMMLSVVQAHKHTLQTALIGK